MAQTDSDHRTGRRLDQRNCNDLQVLNTLFTGNGLFGTFSGAGICFGPLTSYRQSKPMPHAAVTFDISKSTNVLLNLTSQRTFDRVVSLEDRRNSTDFFVGQITRLSVRDQRPAL